MGGGSGSRSGTSERYAVVVAVARLFAVSSGAGGRSDEPPQNLVTFYNRKHEGLGMSGKRGQPNRKEQGPGKLKEGAKRSHSANKQAKHPESSRRKVARLSTIPISHVAPASLTADNSPTDRRGITFQRGVTVGIEWANYACGRRD